MNTLPNSAGHILVILVFFIGIAMVMIPTSIALMTAESKQSTLLSLSSEAYAIAESGAENAIIRLLRDPSYAGETLTVGQGTATITVTGSGSKTIRSEGRSGNALRIIQVTTDTNGGITTVSSWSEVY